MHFGYVIFYQNLAEILDVKILVMVSLNSLIFFSTTGLIERSNECTRSIQCICFCYARVFVLIGSILQFCV